MLRRRQNPIRVEARQHHILNVAEKQQKLIKVEEVVTILNTFMIRSDWQNGPSFFAGLKNLMKTIDPATCDVSDFRAEFGAECTRQITSSNTVADQGINAEFDLLVGI